MKINPGGQLERVDIVGRGPLTVQTAINGAKGTFPDGDRDRWLALIRLLERDVYRVRSASDGTLRYKFGIVERWWRWHRDVAPPVSVDPA